MTDYATNPATTIAQPSTTSTGVAYSIQLQPGTDYSQNHAMTAIPGALPRPQIGLVFPRITR